MPLVVDREQNLLHDILDLLRLPGEAPSQE
jgi:hypothetical protein